MNTFSKDINLHNLIDECITELTNQNIISSDIERNEITSKISDKLSNNLYLHIPTNKEIVDMIKLEVSREHNWVYIKKLKNEFSNVDLLPALRKYLDTAFEKLSLQKTLIRNFSHALDLLIYYIGKESQKNLEIDQQNFTNVLQELCLLMQNKYPFADSYLGKNLSRTNPKKQLQKKVQHHFGWNFYEICDEEISQMQEEKNIDINVLSTLMNKLWGKRGEIIWETLYRVIEAKFRKNECDNLEKAAKKTINNETSQKIDIQKANSSPSTNPSLEYEKMFQQIEETVSLFSLPEEKSTKIISRLRRLLKNNKDCKISDYIWPNAPIEIPPQDEGKFFALLEEVGIQIQTDEPPLWSFEKSKTSIWQEESSQIKTPDPETSSAPLEILPSIEDIEAVLDFWFKKFTEVGYTIRNENFLKKQMRNFCINKENTKALLTFLNSPEKIQNPEKKTAGGSNIYSIAGYRKDGALRILLKKTKDWSGKDIFEIDSFHSDHDNYDDRLKLLRSGL